jgi:hypothetical protein
MEQELTQAEIERRAGELARRVMAKPHHPRVKLSGKSAGYVKREDFDITLGRLAKLLDGGSVDPQLVKDTRALVARYPFQLFRCVVGGSLAVNADHASNVDPRTEPTDLALRLISALSANDRDAFAVIAHDFRSLAGVATPG